MASYGWRKRRPVDRALFEEGHRFSFEQAVRLLETLDPSRAEVGTTIGRDGEAVRFTGRIEFDFPASEVSSITPGEIGRPGEAGAPSSPSSPSSPRMEISFLGLAGFQGPLPATLAELVLDRAHRGDPAMRDFLDIFNHRLASLYFRGRRKYRPALSNRRPDRGRVASTLFSMIGLGTGDLADRMRVADRALLSHAGLLVTKPRTAVGLERLLSRHFGVAVRLVPFVGRWLQLASDQWTRIGSAETVDSARATKDLTGRLPATLGRNHRLGDGAILGRRVWDQQAAFEIQLGPLDLKDLLGFLPTGDRFESLEELVRFYAGEDFEVQYRLQLNPSEVPGLSVGQAGDSRLGWSARLGSSGVSLERGPAGDPKDLLAVREGLEKNEDALGSPENDDGILGPQERAKPGASIHEQGPDFRSLAETRIGRAGGARLGWTSWLKGDPMSGDGEIGRQGRQKRQDQAVPSVLLYSRTGEWSMVSEPGETR